MISIEDVKYTYSRTSSPALTNIRLCVLPGEIVSVIGASGSGKSTLARLMNGSLSAEYGRVVVDGFDPAYDDASSYEVARRVGLVRQDPTCQFVTSCVYDEVAFGPCNLGLSPHEIRERVDQALVWVNLKDLASCSLDTLSGGEAERLALACVLAMKPSYLVLDEVTSQLDASARADVDAIILRLRDEGVGIVRITHYLVETLTSDRIVVCEDGRLVFEGSPKDFLVSSEFLARSCVVDDGLSPALRLLVQEGYDFSCGADPKRLQSFVSDHGLELAFFQALKETASQNQELEEAAVQKQVLEEAAVQKNFSPTHHQNETRERASAFSKHTIQANCIKVCNDVYGSQDILHDISCEAHAGEIVLVIGPSGAGKTTLAASLAGVQRLDAGEVLLDGKRVKPGRVGLGFQHVEDQLFCDTVFDDVAFGPRNLAFSEDDVSGCVEQALATVGLSSKLMRRNPLELSGGQRRLVALAGVIALGAAAYVFDEPLAGLDACARRSFRALVRLLAKRGAPVIIVTHDVVEWSDVADRVVGITRGKIAWKRPAKDLFCDLTLFSMIGLAVPSAVALRSYGQERKEDVL